MNMPLRYRDLTDPETRVERGDWYNPWGSGWKPLPPSYGWKIKTAPASKFRRPIYSAEQKKALKELL